MRVFKSTSVAVLAAAVSAGGFWLAGFNFTERGGTAIACYLFSIACAAYGFGFTMMCTDKDL